MFETYGYTCVLFQAFIHGNQKVSFLCETLFLKSSSQGFATQIKYHELSKITALGAQPAFHHSVILHYIIYRFIFHIKF